jgi:hypothetical protein
LSPPARVAVHSRPRGWTSNAIRLIEADAHRSADTHLLRYPLPSAWTGNAGIELYLKDETTHITGSLKHRLARSLFLYALCNGWIEEDTTVVEASSGSTAVSEAYFAALLGLPFVAVMPASTSASKVSLIESQGGRCHFVESSSDVYAEAERVAKETGGHYLDQFTNAERATDWRGNNNIAESIFVQMRDEQHPVPDWIVVGAGTGGTSATIGRYIRYQRHATRLWWSTRRIPRSIRPTPNPGTTSWLLRRLESRALAGPASSRLFCPTWSQRLGGHAAGRQRRPLRRHLLLRRVGQGPRAGHVHARGCADRIRTLGPVGLSPTLVDVTARSGHQQPQHTQSQESAEHHGA